MMRMGHCGRRVCLVLVYLSIGAVVSSQVPPGAKKFCESKDIPVALAVHASPIKIRSFSFSSSSYNHGSSGNLTLVNTGNKPVIDAVIVSDLLDGNGNR